MTYTILHSSFSRTSLKAVRAESAARGFPILSRAVPGQLCAYRSRRHLAAARHGDDVPQLVWLVEGA